MRVLAGIGLMFFASGAMAGAAEERAVEAMLAMLPYLARQEVRLEPCRMVLRQVGKAPIGDTDAVFDLGPMDFAGMRVSAAGKGAEVVIIPWTARDQKRIWAAMEKLKARRTSLEDAIFAKKLPKEEERAAWEGVDKVLLKEAQAGRFGAALAGSYYVQTVMRKGKSDRVSFGAAYPLELAVKAGRAEAFRGALKDWAGKTCD